MTRALVLSRYFPFNPQRINAVYQRLGTQVQALARVVEQVECLFFVPPDQQRTAEELRAHEAQLRALWSPAVTLRLAPVVREAAPAGAWQRLGRGIFKFAAQPLAWPLANPEAQAALTAALRPRPDVILAHRLSAMCLLLAHPAAAAGVPVFFDLDDVEHVAWFRRLLRDPSWRGERALLLQTPRLLLAELQAVRRSAATFVCSETDRRYLARLSGTDHVRLVPNSVAFPPAPAADASEALVLFVGSMGSRPNAQAVDLLIESVWPHIRAQFPEARLAIIGNGAELTRSYPSRDERVSFLGFVDDLAAWYARARVVCCPIRHGSGTRVKIIEAASYAKAIVSTRVGAEGLEFTDGEEILLRERPRALAEACLALLRDPAAAARLGRAARAHAQRRYERTAVIEELEGMFRATAGLRSSLAAAGTGAS